MKFTFHLPLELALLFDLFASVSKPNAYKNCTRCMPFEPYQLPNLIGAKKPNKVSVKYEPLQYILYIYIGFITCSRARPALVHDANE